MIDKNDIYFVIVLFLALVIVGYVIGSFDVDSPVGRRLTNSGDDGEVLVSSLEGYGDAYVCVNSQGRLFRSSSPCT